MAIVIKESGEEIEIEIESLLSMQNIVCGRIKFIHITYDKILVVNSDQHSEHLKENYKATHISSTHITGDAILCDRRELY